MIDGIYKPVYATFNIMCKILYNSYKRALSIFNDIHSDEKKNETELRKTKVQTFGK